MGVSFKVSKTGTRFRPKPLQPDTVSEENVAAPESFKEIGRILGNNESTSASTKKLQIEVNRWEEDVTIPESEVSFTLNLSRDGYSIGNPSEATLQDGHKFLHPYDRASETLFSSIESGRLPGDILDDIPCKYVDGKLVCEVRDYRKCTPEAGFAVSSSDGSPIVHKVHLRMTLENVVKDIPLISDSTWTYGDLMELESRILKALQPQLCLDPTPKFDRLCDNPVPTKLNLGLCSARRKRLRQMPEITVTSNNKFHGKKVCIDRVTEGSNCRSVDAGPIYGAAMSQNVHENLTTQNVGPRARSFIPDASVALPIVSHQQKYQLGAGNPRMMQDHESGLISNAGASPPGQDMMISCSNHMKSDVSSVHRKRENQDGQLSPMSSLNKIARHASLGPDAYQQQHMAPHMDNFQGSESHWKATLLQQQSIARGIQYANTDMQKYPQQVFEGGLNQEGGIGRFTVAQQGMRSAKEQSFETERLERPELNQNNYEMHILEAERNHIDLQQSRLQQRLPQHGLSRSNFPQTPWNSLGQPLDNNSRKEEQFPKRKSVQSPRVSAGGLPQSPLSSKSGEFSSGSMGSQFGPVATSALGSLQKEKMVGGTSMISSAIDSVQWQLPNKRKSKSLPKTAAMNGVGSPASVNNMSGPLNASSPPVVAPSLADPMMLDRFSKIDMVSGRHQIHRKKNKTDDKVMRKHTTYPSQDLLLHLSSDYENFRDETCTMPLSKSVVGGSINVCKIRVLNFVQTERILQGNDFSAVPRARTRMILSGKPNGGTIAMHYGDIQDNEYLAAEDYLPTLPNAHIADLHAAQLCSLMIREGYCVEDHIQPKPPRPDHASTSQSNNASEIPQNSAGVDNSDAVSGREIAKTTNSDNPSLSQTLNQPSSRIVSPGALQNSQGFFHGVSIQGRPRLNPQSALQQQNQQQPSQLQRSPLMLAAANSLSNMNTLVHNPNIPIANQLVNKHSPLQLQMLQQQQQQMQKKMMMGLGTAMGMGNMGNNMVGIGGIGNVMGIGGQRGVAGNAISASMGQISGLGNMGQNTINLGQASNISNFVGALTPVQAQAFMAAKLRMAHNRSSNMFGGPQSSIGGFSGARQMHPASTGLSMLGQTLNRANTNTLQRMPMGPMGPPKLNAEMNLYMNQQQPQQQKQMQYQQEMQQQMQQQQFQQQETNSTLQAVVSPPQVGSPSMLGIPQQLNPQSQQQQKISPQQMSQRTPISPQLSSGTLYPLSGGHSEACTASPQLSSQTLGSVGSIPNSPMELQGVNKSNSVSNA